MRSGELSFKFIPSLRVTWTIRDFFRLTTESGFSLRSPDFTFADGRYCLRLLQEWSRDFDDGIVIELLNSHDPDPGRAVSYEVELKPRSEETFNKGIVSRNVDEKKLFCFDLNYYRDLYVPGGTLTVLCFVRSREPGSAESLWAQTRVFPEYRMTGNLSSEPSACLCVTWRLPAFFQPTREFEAYLVSPDFHFSTRSYRLYLYPSPVVQIILGGPLSERYASHEVGLGSTTGEEIEIKSFGGYMNREFSMLRSKLDAMQRVRFPDGRLTVFCWMHSREPSSDKEALTGGVAKVLSDYKRLLLKGSESDACFVVCGKVFQAHKCVLRARSPIFEAMFDHEMAEKASGRVVIDDVKPDHFQDFLEYLYTGRVESFCDDNVLGLYAAADKYDVPTLRSECVEYMCRNLSVDNFCDVITSALLHHEQDLLEQAVEFFKKNAAGIILTGKWQQFVSENSTTANELFIKLHVPGKESENVLLP